jgi:hypothetical protein
MDFVQSPTGGTVIAFTGFAAYLSLVLWARRGLSAGRGPVLLAASFTAAIVAAANVLAYALGLWQWWGYELPLIVQAGMLFCAPATLFALLISGYQWLGGHTRRPLLVYGLVAALVLIPLTVAGDLHNLARGKLAFGGGYAIWMDVLLGQAFLWLPVLLYWPLSNRLDRGRVHPRG